MKSLLFILLFAAQLGFGQERSIREVSARMTSDYTTEFNGMEINFVNTRIQSFLSQQLQMTSEGDAEINVTDNGIEITEGYHYKIAINGVDKRLKVIYNCEPNDKDEMIIMDCVIEGDFDPVVSFFVRFWETSLNFDEVKGDELVMCHYITDKAVFTPMNNKAKIVVSKN